MGKTKNQHFVPQFYLKNFSIDKKTIGTYVIGKEKLIEKSSIKDQASKDYLYTDNQEVEERLGKIESETAPIIRGIIQNPTQPLNDEQVQKILSFMIIQIGRTPAMAREMLSGMEEITRNVMKDYIKRMPDYKPDKEKGLDEYLSKCRLEAKDLNLLALQIYESIEKQGLLNGLGYKILINKTKDDFITSDNSACLYNQFRERMGCKNYSLSTRGIELYMPISPQLAIFFYDPSCYKVGDRCKMYVDFSDEKDIFELNKLVVCYAEKALYFKSSSVGISYLQKLKRLFNRYKLTSFNAISVIPVDSKSRYFEDEKLSMYCRFSPSMVKEKRKNRTQSRKIKNLSDPMLRKNVYYSQRHVYDTLSELL